MKTRFLGMAAALLLAGTLVSGEASAANEFILEALTCTSAARIAETDATCVSVWHDNSPPASTGYAMGSTYAAESFCHKWGTVKVHIDIEGSTDRHFVLDSAGTIRGASVWNDINKMTCCRSASALCTKQEVKRSSLGQIQVWNSTTSVYDLVDVSTQRERYNYCQAKSTSIFCTANVSEDVNTVPTLSCGDAMCTASDCEDEWAESVTADEFFECEKYDTGFTIAHKWTAASDETPFCRVKLMNCTVGGQGFGSNLEFEYDDLSSLIFCKMDNDIWVHLGTSCPSGYTEVEVEEEEEEDDSTTTSTTTTTN